MRYFKHDSNKPVTGFINPKEQLYFHMIILQKGQYLRKKIFNQLAIISENSQIFK